MRWLLIGLVVVAAMGVGLGIFTFGYARGASYLTNDPQACANCHVMQGHFDDWRHSSHRSVAACNDCHTPPGLIPKYFVKARNGFWHSSTFTTDIFMNRFKSRRATAPSRKRPAGSAMPQSWQPSIRTRTWTTPTQHPASAVIAQSDI